MLPADGYPSNTLMDDSTGSLQIGPMEVMLAAARNGLGSRGGERGVS
jgi:hypothetical protein